MFFYESCMRQSRSACTSRACVSAACPLMAFPSSFGCLVEYRFTLRRDIHDVVAANDDSAKLLDCLAAFELFGLIKNEI
jgi:hypothetical protein